jgi:hypothetical protein
MKLLESRKVHLYGLLAFAFAPSVVSSLVIWLGTWRPGPASNGRLVFKITRQLINLALLAWVLRRQGKTFQSIRLFPPTLKDIGHSVLLFLGATVGNGCMYLFLHLVVLLAIEHWAHRTWNISAALFGSTVTFLPFLFALINPFDEELIVRAFLITEVEETYQAPKLAAVASVILQTSYHLYQGLLSALTLGTSFTLFTVYFVRKRRILPVILAHLYMDVLALLLYAWLLHHAIHVK